MNADTMRRKLICWLYLVTTAHVLIGLALPWIGHLQIVEAYHHGIETAFWGGAAPLAAREQQIWWISLFGPTVLTTALWMGALIYLGDRHRSTFAWAWLAIGVIAWAPQDMWISLQRNVWPHVWIDILSVLVIVPPVLWLWRHDRRGEQT